MPRILRSPGSKSFRLENVSVPNADGARVSGKVSKMTVSVPNPVATAGPVTGQWIKISGIRILCKDPYAAYISLALLTTSAKP